MPDTYVDVKTLSLYLYVGLEADLLIGTDVDQVYDEPATAVIDLLIKFEWLQVEVS